MTAQEKTEETRKKADTYCQYEHYIPWHKYFLEEQLLKPQELESQR